MPRGRALINTIKTSNQRGNTPGSSLDHLAPWNRASQLHLRPFRTPSGLVRRRKATTRVLESWPHPPRKWFLPPASHQKRAASTVQRLPRPLSISWLLCERTPLLQGPQGIGFISTSRDSPSEVSVAPSNQLSLQTALNTDCLRKTALQN